MTYLEPLLPLLLALSALAVWMSGGAGKRLRYAAGGATAFLTLAAWPPADWLAARHLEAWYPVKPFRAPQPQAAAIVVLSSSVSPPQWERPFPLPDYETVKRCEQAAWLFHRWHGQVPVLASGGKGTGPGRIAYSETMRAWLIRAGVPDPMIWTETDSRSTYENALLSAPILRRHGVANVVLVVDSQSMLRAEACFRKLGFGVIPAPSSFRYLGSWGEEVLPSWQALRRNEVTLHETLGFVWYWWRGRI